MAITGTVFQNLLSICNNNLSAGTAKTTDCLVKEVQFALKYFQDVVSKQTYEMLPGCATVVLETVLAIQVFNYRGNLTLDIGMI